MQRDKTATFSREAWAKCADLGLLGLPVPKEYGGVGADVLTTVIALEALGYACTDNGLVFSLNAQMWACETPIIHFGTEEQKQRYLPGLSDGSLLAAHGMSEPGSGSDAFGLSTVAERCDGGYVSQARRRSSRMPRGRPLCRVRDDRSLARLRRHHRLPGREGDSGPLGRAAALENGAANVADERGDSRGCEVGEDAVLGEPGGGMAVFNSSMVWERSCILASAVGAMERQLEQSIVYAQERKQFGKSIGSFQAVAVRSWT